MEQNLLDRMLNTYLDVQTPVTVTLQNKIRIAGKIKAFDSYVIIIDGHRREIVFRHAVSSLAPQIQEQRIHQVPAQQRPAQPKMPPKSAKTFSRKSAPPHPQPLIASPGDPGLNNGMKEGLLKWMQEQKAAK
jgi:host factor-I protein